MSLLTQLGILLILLCAPTLTHAAALDTPRPDSVQSGIGLISGWKCSANGRLTIRFDGGAEYPLPYGSSREDTRSTCGHAATGFAAPMNWATLDAGEHTAVVYDNGVEFARATFTVVTAGVDFLQGVTGSGTVTLSNGQRATLEWSTASQSFVVTDFTTLGDGGLDQFVGTWEFTNSQTSQTFQFSSTEECEENPHAQCLYADNTEYAVLTTFAEYVAGCERGDYAYCEHVEAAHEEFQGDYPYFLITGTDSECHGYILSEPQENTVQGHYGYAPISCEEYESGDPILEDILAQQYPTTGNKDDSPSLAFELPDSDAHENTPAQAPRLSVQSAQTCTCPDDHGNTRGAATRLTVPSNGGRTTRAGNIERRGDIDYFRFSVSRPGNVEVQTTGSTDTHGTLEDGSGRSITVDSNSGSGSNFRISRNLSPGTYYVRVEGGINNRTNTGAYSLQVHFTPSPGPQDDHGNTRGAATQLTVPSNGGRTIRAGNIERRGDIDYFRFSVSRPGNVEVQTTGSTDTHGFLEDSRGRLLTSNNDGGSGRNFRLFRRVSPGTYYIRVTEYGGNSTGTYSLQVHFTPSPGPQDDHGNTRSAASRLSFPASGRGTVSTARAGNIEPRGDIDYFRFTISQNRGSGTVVIETTGSTDTYGSLEDSSGSLDRPGRVLVRNDDSGSGRNFRISRRVSPGTYYIRVTEYGNNSTGAYSLQVRFTPIDDTPRDDHGNTRGTATRFTISSNGSRITRDGNIEPRGDIDYFRFTMSRTDTVVIETTGSTDTYGSLEDSSGRVLARNDDSGSGGNFRISRRLSPGTYYIRVTGWSGRTGAYTLLVRSGRFAR